MVSERALACIISIAFDRDLPGQDEKAMACYRDLVQKLAQQGYHSYRLGIGMMSAMGEPGPYADLLQNIKRTLDPRGILAPGRYVSHGGSQLQNPPAGARSSRSRTPVCD